ncbi:MAG: endonuclease/exonuclease/phosphatase family protein [Bacteroidetes bacterium]|nr:MAG: endonuclease/exonuclease/phosphatase family protein [Bacteroidota bacterium]
MKKILPAICLLFLVADLRAQKSLNVLTFNIRFDNPKDAPNDWPSRKDKVTSQILFHEADIVGIQEALHNQLMDMQNDMSGYKFTGVARDDGKQSGEYSCIFYNTKRLELLASETFWLSQTPTVAGSKSWDAAITRVVTWARFKDKQTKKVFYQFNTHFDHVGKIARRESAALLLRAVDSIAGKTPAVITGDFNAQPQDEPIMVILDAGNPLKLTDSKTLSATGHYGPQGTFNAFGPKEQADKPIDYIFLKGSWRVLQHATLSQTWFGRFSSDHFPVFARLRLSKK